MTEDIDDMTLEEYLLIVLASAKAIRDDPKNVMRVKIEIEFIINSLVDMLEARWIPEGCEDDDGSD